VADSKGHVPFSHQLPNTTFNNFTEGNHRKIGMSVNSGVHLQEQSHIPGAASTREKPEIPSF
jgi:hypothetical protein